MSQYRWSDPQQLIREEQSFDDGRPVFEEHEARFHRHYKVNFRGSSLHYADLEPVYRQGFRFGAHDGSHEHRDFDQAEEDLRILYEEYWGGDSSWRGVREAAEFAFDYARAVAEPRQRSARQGGLTTEDSELPQQALGE